MELGYDLLTEGTDLADAVFVIGGLGASETGLTLKMAEAEGIKHARLPMERHVGVNVDLSITQVIKIINDYRLTRDWFYSFRWVPFRFFLHRFLTSETDRCAKIKLNKQPLW